MIEWMAIAVDIVSWILLIIGSVCVLIGGLGVLRMPDFYTRMHAAGKGDTLSSIMILGGLALLNFEDFTLLGSLVSLKIICIV